MQTPCQKKSIWHTIRMGEDCEECVLSGDRGGVNAGPAGEGIKRTAGKVVVRIKGRKR